MIRVKICGITNPEDAQTAVDAGADALGFVFWKKSPRYVAPDTAAAIIKGLPPFVTTVGVFVNEGEGVIRSTLKRAGLDRVQFHGDEPPELIARFGPGTIKAIRVRDKGDILKIRDYDASAYLLDAYREGLPGGTGRTFDWGLAVKAKELGRVILSGGLNPKNVTEAIGLVHPYGVDVSSGVEMAPGKKDRAKVREFIRLAKGTALDP